MKAKTVLMLLLLISLKAAANMASPITKGTLGSSPFISRYVDILNEKILIIPDSLFETAYFKIEYQIKVSQSGIQVPLLFYASDYREDFKVWLDNAEIRLKPAPEYYENLEGTPLKDFGYLFDSGSENEERQVIIENPEYAGFYVSVNNLKFFEADLEEGTHTIRVDYVAESWSDRSSWVTEYSFRYALAPAKYWKSFGELEITLDNSRFGKKIKTNLGIPVQGNTKAVTKWIFSAIPVEMLQVNYIPELNSAAGILIALGPTGLTVIFAVFLVLIHLLLMLTFRKKNPAKRFSRVMVAGSLIIPLLILTGYMASFSMIDASIGKDAGGRHGYTFLIFVFYPVIVPVYWVLMWWFDRTLKRKTS
jgi:hypothetical protein